MRLSTLTLLLITFVIMALCPSGAISKDLDEGDPRCNVAVASEFSQSSTRPPTQFTNLQKELKNSDIKSNIVFFVRPPDSIHRASFIEWQILVFPEDSPKAKAIIQKTK